MAKELKSGYVNPQFYVKEEGVSLIFSGIFLRLYITTIKTFIEMEIVLWHLIGSPNVRHTQ